MMIRNYYLKEDTSIEWNNQAIAGHEPVIFLLSGIYPSINQLEEDLKPEQANVLICRQTVTSVIQMPSKTAFGSLTISASKALLNKVFGTIGHPIVTSILEDKGNFAYEIKITPEIIRVANDMRQISLSEILESLYYKLKCEELLCHIFSLLIQRDPVPTTAMHINDIQAIYAIKMHLQENLDKPPNVALLAREAGMSEPKLRRLFNQTFGKGVFDYFQSMRMVEAARLLKEKRLSVTEVGYALGFTNLSHFTRVFESHHQLKPKKYSASLESN
jgi:AraC-like DNA-binding protein